MVVFDFPGVSVAQYDKSIQKLEKAGQGRPKGRLYHAACAKGPGVFVVDVWESPKSFEAFGQVLVPILLELGAKPGQPIVHELHNVIAPMEARRTVTV